MKYIVEFGVRGGAHTENQVMHTREQAERLARSLEATGAFVGAVTGGFVYRAF